MNYKDTYDHLYSHGYGDGPAKSLWQWKNPRAKSVLDVGCGRCGLAEALDSDVELYGVDVSNVAIRTAGDRLARYKETKAADFTQKAPLPACWPKVDVVFCSDVIEHISPIDLDAFFHNLVDACRPGGNLLLSICLRPSEWKDASGQGLHLSIMNRKEWGKFLRDRIKVIGEKGNDRDLWVFGERTE